MLLLLEHETHFLHIYFANLSNYLLCCSLGNSSEEGTTLLGVGKVLAMDDLEFPILLNKGIGDNSIVVVRDPRDGGKRACDLRRG
jgi:hypothetical protein